MNTQSRAQEPRPSDGHGVPSQNVEETERLLWEKTQPYANPQTNPPLDDADDLYQTMMNENSKKMFKEITGIEDDGELRRHVIAVRKNAYSIYGYPCIRCFAFTRLEIVKLPGYPQLLQLGKRRPGALFLDVGCCFGSDIRKVAYDGWPVENIIGTDLREEYWDCGHELFKSTPKSFPAAFIPGDLFDDNFLSTTAIPKPRPTPTSDPHDLTSLNPLKGKISGMHSAAVFHLFSEEGQMSLARRLASLLSPEPGSMIFGWHGGRPVKGYRYEVIPRPRKHNQCADHGGKDRKAPGDADFNLDRVYMFCHSPDSWKEMWEEVFKGAKIKVDVEMVQVERLDTKRWTDPQDFNSRWWELRWCVTRL